MRIRVGGWLWDSDSMGFSERTDTILNRTELSRIWLDLTVGNWSGPVIMRIEAGAGMNLRHGLGYSVSHTAAAWSPIQWWTAPAGKGMVHPANPPLQLGLGQLRQCSTGWRGGFESPVKQGIFLPVNFHCRFYGGDGLYSPSAQSHASQSVLTLPNPKHCSRVFGHTNYTEAAHTDRKCFAVLGTTVPPQ